MTIQKEHTDSPTLSQSVVLITGALTGIGRATALAFAKEGSRIVVSGRRVREGAELEAELVHMGAEAEFIYADVRIDKDLEKGTSVPPLREHVIIYFSEKRYPESDAMDFYNYHEKNKWKNIRKKRIANWKIAAWSYILSLSEQHR